MLISLYEAAGGVWGLTSRMGGTRIMDGGLYILMSCIRRAYKEKCRVYPGNQGAKEGARDVESTLDRWSNR